MGISGTRGGSIDSLQVMGVEVVDENDLGREIQASIFVPVGPHQYNPQDSGTLRVSVDKNKGGVGMKDLKEGERRCYN